MKIFLKYHKIGERTDQMKIDEIGKSKTNKSSNYRDSSARKKLRTKERNEKA